MNLEEEIKNYIKNENKNGVILLSGDWGSGKTYIVDEIINNFNDKEKYLLIKISLFGISSQEILEKKIKDEIIQNTFSEKSNLIEGTAKFCSKLMDFHPQLKKIKSVVSIDIYNLINIDKKIRMLNSINKFKNLVLFFDDFERCEINSKLTLGIINDYCENKGIKIIIIANENKIDDSKNEFNKFKEKVISRTYILSRDLDNVIQNIIAEYKETNIGYKSFLQKNQDFIISVFNVSKINNLRILKYSLSDFERLYRICIEIDIDNSIDKSSIFYSFMCLYFETKKIEIAETENESSNSDNDSSKLKNELNLIKKKENSLELDSLKKRYIYFGRNKSNLLTVKEWIMNNQINEDAIKTEIEDHYIDVINNYKNFLQGDYWELNDNLIENGIKTCLKEGYEGKLELSELIVFLNTVCNLKKDGYKIEDIDLKKLNDGLLKRQQMNIDEIVNDLEYSLSLENHLKNISSVFGRIDLEDTIKHYYENIELGKRKKTLISNLQSEDLYKLNYLNLKCFDQELLDEVKKAFMKSRNENKMAIIQTICSCKFDNNQFSNKDDIKTTIHNIKQLIFVIKAEKKTTREQFSKILYNKTIQMLEELVDELSKKNISEDVNKH